MSDHTATVRWQRHPLEAFHDGRYSRRHEIAFDGGAVVPGSSSPHVVPLPLSDASAIDPEEMFVAALASCHMLWFLSLAAGRGLRVERYVDEARGTMGRNAEGRMALTQVTLRPRVGFIGEHLPSAEEIAALHHQAHERCFIANSVRTDVRVEPQQATPHG
jgi:organic hydroperoxide reductase OsmC/OhrA